MQSRPALGIRNDTCDAVVLVQVIALRDVYCVVLQSRPVLDQKWPTVDDDYRVAMSVKVCMYRMFIAVVLVLVLFAILYIINV